MTQDGKSSFANGFINLGNLAMGSAVLAQAIPNKDNFYSSTAILWGISMFTVCYMLAYILHRKKGGEFK